MKSVIKKLHRRYPIWVNLLIFAIMMYNREIYAYINWLYTESQIPTFMLTLVIICIVIVLLILINDSSIKHKVNSK